MNQPTVCCVMLVNGRPEMVKRAIRSFREQTYSRKRLLIFDTGPFTGQSVFSDCDDMPQLIAWDGRKALSLVGGTASVGVLRNWANAASGDQTQSEIICHFDSDDLSHPRRIEEQVALLQASGKEVVGYRDMLFWRQEMINDGMGPPDSVGPDPDGEAWLYSNNDPRYCLGTSLCYWRRVWEARPFPDLPKTKGGTGEDTEWLREVISLGVLSTKSLTTGPAGPWQTQIDDKEQPRMIASIHGGNTQDYAGVVGASNNWRRVPEWDEHCRKVMAL